MTAANAFDGVTVTWIQDDRFTDGIGINIGDRKHCDDADEVLEAVAAAVARRVKGRVEYATVSGGMAPGALIMIPSSLFKPRAKVMAFDAAREVLTDRWPRVAFRTVEQPRKEA